MFYWKVTHQHRLYGGLERKDIGIYHSFSLAEDAVAQLVTKEGFRDTSDGFLIRKVFRLFCPKLLDQTYWTDGFITYSDIENIDKKIICDETFYLMKHLVFLVNDYGFSFNKVSLGDLRDENGKLWFYGPFNCYSFYRNGICINILNLVQRQDWYITITKEFSEDQNYIKSGQEIDSYYAYHLELLAAKIREDLELNGEVFGNKV